VRNALVRLTEVNAKNSTSPVLGGTSPDAIGKSFFRLFALSFSLSMYWFKMNMALVASEKATKTIMKRPICGHSNRMQPSKKLNSQTCQLSNRNSLT
jgi:hypothetical protein